MLTMYHDSRNIAYRSPFGAAKAGSKVTLRLKVENAQDEVQVFVRLWQEKAGEKLLPMILDSASALYTVSFTAPEEGSLLWYYFVARQEGNTFYYGNNREQQGGVGTQSLQQPSSYQITVYDRDAVTPAWFKEAVVYQIFPDRFCKAPSQTATLEGKHDAVIHSAWEDKPYYCKDATGRVVQYDFFGGNLAGIRSKLAYLQDLGITAIYLNPIFASRSNHRYDTSDYLQIDSFLGTNEEFALLCQEAKKLGIRIILDGVFSHTGDDSRYFNKYGTYKDVGAYQSKDSPYYNWYHFFNYPDSYRSWWGVDVLPEVEETTPSYMDFIINSEGSVLRYWLKQGISGWRLDVADELPLAFLKQFYKTLKEVNPEAVLIGEVWEDVSNKISYGEQREYLCGHKLDGAMNYVFRKIMLGFCTGAKDGAATQNDMAHILENYPPENLWAMLNVVSTHDVQRILTALQTGNGDTAPEERLKLLALWQCTMPGAPCIYYGDEAGVTGGTDPDNRRTYPWGKENKDLQAWYKKVIHLRRDHKALATGRYIPLVSAGDVLAYARVCEGGVDLFGSPAKDETLFVVLNRSGQAQTVTVPTDGFNVALLTDALRQGSATIPVYQEKFTVTVPPCSGVVLCRAVQQKSAPVAETLTKRQAGILLHPTSLPREEAGGTLGKSARDFVDFLAQAGQKVWQILPLNMPGKGHSPYMSISAFAGNTDLISVADLSRRGWLIGPFSDEGSLKVPGEVFEEFCHKQAFWLDDFTLFAALHKYFHEASWTTWPTELKQRDKSALVIWRRKLKDEILREEILQFCFFTQWQDVLSYAHSKGISIMGDLPLFVAPDSADVWAHPEIFVLDKEGSPALQSAVPPDYFSAKGQLWGSPLYNWQALDKENFAWWVERCRLLSECVDLIRLDHFRGFAACWGVPQGAEDATKGSWQKGPGEEFFKIIQIQVPRLRFVAEDLGIITEDVEKMRLKLGFPGMKVLQFHTMEHKDARMSFDTEENCVAYTGTHDNNTLVGWLEQEITPAFRDRLCQMLGVPATTADEALGKKLIAYLYSRQARLVVTPLQDVLGLSANCRMNTPGTVGEANWSWQFAKEQLTAETAIKLAGLCRKYAR
jgi:4-alpha-glucanotransferase/glycosidase